MSNDYVKIGGIYFREDQVKSATYGGGLNGSHNVELMNGSLFVFGQQPKNKYPEHVLDSFPDESRPSIVIGEDERVIINDCNLGVLKNCEGKKDHYVIIDSKVNHLNLEEQDLYDYNRIKF